MKIQVTKQEFRDLEGIAYGNCPFITMGTEEQVNHHVGIIKNELNRKYEISR